MYRHRRCRFLSEAENPMPLRTNRLGLEGAFLVEPPLRRRFRSSPDPPRGQNHGFPPSPKLPECERHPERFGKRRTLLDIRLYEDQSVFKFLVAHVRVGAAVRRPVERRPHLLPVQHLLGPAPAENDVAKLPGQDQESSAHDRYTEEVQPASGNRFAACWDGSLSTAIPEGIVRRTRVACPAVRQSTSIRSLPSFSPR